MLRLIVTDEIVKKNRLFSFRGTYLGFCLKGLDKTRQDNLITFFAHNTVDRPGT